MHIVDYFVIAGYFALVMYLGYYSMKKCAMPGSIGYLGKRDLVGLRGNWWDW